MATTPLCHRTLTADSARGRSCIGSACALWVPTASTAYGNCHDNRVAPPFRDPAPSFGSCLGCTHYRSAAPWTCPEAAVDWSDAAEMGPDDTEWPATAPPCPGFAKGSALDAHEGAANLVLDETLRAENASLVAAANEARMEGYRAAILTNGSTPYPLLDVLRILADATDHLFREHDCDSHGWEVRKEAAVAAREIIAEVTRVCGENIVNQGHGDGGSDFACNFRHKENA